MTMIRPVAGLPPRSADSPVGGYSDPGAGRRRFPSIERRPVPYVEQSDDPQPER